MQELGFKVHTSKEQYEEMKKMLRTEIGDEELDGVVGGNDSPKMKGKFDPPINWTCHYCGATMLLRNVQDGPKHMTKCPNNPYK